MRTEVRTHDSEHRWAQQMLTWLVNETLGGRELARLRNHLETCAACRADLEFERRVAARVAQDVVVPHSSQVGFARLLGRIDGAQSDGERTIRGWPRWLSFKAASESSGPRPWFAVAVAANAALLALTLSTAWLTLGPPHTPDYRTLSRESAAFPGDHLQVVFAASVTVADIQRLLGGINGRIVGGPSPAGVVLVTLAPDPGTPDLDTAAQQLSQQPGVVFAAAQRAVDPP